MARFDRLARVYDRVNPYGNAEALLANLAPEPGDTIVDAGGGTGQVGASLAPRCRRVIVVDPSAGMLAELRRKGRPLVPLLGAGEHLPLRDASVDRVVMVDALHHVPRQDECLREIHRVLRPDGRAVIEEFRMDRWWVRWPFLLVERLSGFGSRFDRSEGWRKRMEDAGFRVTVRAVTWRDVHFVLEKRK